MNPILDKPSSNVSVSMVGCQMLPHTFNLRAAEGEGQLTSTVFNGSDRGRINASTDLPLKHTRNKFYKKLVLQHLVLQLFDDSRKRSTRFVSTEIRSTKIWIYRIKFYKNGFYRK